MRPAPTGFRSPSTLLIVSLAMAIAAFVAATVATAGRLREVSIQSEDIYANAMPAVMALSSLREELDRLGMQADADIDSRAADLPSLTDRTAAIREQVDAYSRHATANTSGVWQMARDNVERAIADAQSVRVRLLAHDRDGARVLVDSDLRSDLAAAQNATWHLVETNAAEGLRSARHIESVRRSATLLSFGLDALCVAFALVLALVGYRSIREHTLLVERRSDELEQFAARVAHDLRGPLSPVTMALELLRKEGVANDRSLAIATRGVGRITTLIDDLLAFAVAGGRADFSARASALAVAREAVEDATPMAQSRSVTVEVDPAAPDLAVACPAGVVMSLVSNLVRNAIKYMGDSAERRVTARIVPNGQRVRVEIEDTGPGLPAEAQAAVFAPYVRADRSGQSGLGLGLATVKRLAEAYGGVVGVRSQGAGCTFWFELPLARHQPLPDSVAPSAHLHGGLVSELQTQPAAQSGAPPTPSAPAA